MHLFDTEEDALNCIDNAPMCSSQRELLDALYEGGHLTRYRGYSRQRKLQNFRNYLKGHEAVAEAVANKIYGGTAVEATRDALMSFVDHVYPEECTRKDSVEDLIKDEVDTAAENLNDGYEGDRPVERLHPEVSQRFNNTEETDMSEPFEFQWKMRNEEPMNTAANGRMASPMDCMKVEIKEEPLDNQVSSSHLPSSSGQDRIRDADTNSRPMSPTEDPLKLKDEPPDDQPSVSPSASPPRRTSRPGHISRLLSCYKMGSEVIWSSISIDLEWGCLAGKSCVIGGEEHKSGLRILGLHGWLDNANSFDTLAQHLPSGVELLVLDLPGHGHSDHLPASTQYDLITYVLNIRRAVDKVGWDRFIILGHSMGAGLATSFTALFPERVMALVLLDFLGFKPLTLEDLKVNADILLKAEELRKKEPLVYSEQQIIERLISARGVDSIDEDAAYILLPRSTRQLEGGYTWSHDPRVRARFDCSNEIMLMIIASIKCPLLMIPANQGDSTPVIRKMIKDVIALYRKDAHWFEMAPVEGSHNVHLTHPERVAKPLVPFLQRVALETAFPKTSQAKL